MRCYYYPRRHFLLYYRKSKFFCKTAARIEVIYCVMKICGPHKWEIPEEEFENRMAVSHFPISDDKRLANYGHNLEILLYFVKDSFLNCKKLRSFFTSIWKGSSKWTEVNPKIFLEIGNGKSCVQPPTLKAWECKNHEVKSRIKQAVLRSGQNKRELRGEGAEIRWGNVERATRFGLQERITIGTLTKEERLHFY